MTSEPLTPQPAMTEREATLPPEGLSEHWRGVWGSAQSTGSRLLRQWKVVDR